MLDLDKVARTYARTLNQIGNLKEQILYNEQHRLDTQDSLDSLDDATDRAVLLADMLGLEYDSEYDC